MAIYDVLSIVPLDVSLIDYLTAILQPIAPWKISFFFLCALPTNTITVIEHKNDQTLNQRSEIKKETAYPGLLLLVTRCEIWTQSELIKEEALFLRDLFAN